MKSCQTLDSNGEYDEQNEPYSSKKKTQAITWKGTCLHIILELAECGDVQNVST